jgi:ArsR family transcriptional regulator
MSEFRKYTIELLKVLADPARLEILELLKISKKSSSEIQEKLKRSQSTISKHLSLLADSNIIDFDKENNTKYYKIRYLDIFNLIDHINSVATDITKDKLRDVRDIDVFDTLL